MSSSTSPNFASLLPRPPTPPKDRISKDVDDALRFLEEGHRSPTKELRNTRPKTSVGTPPSNSPTSSHQGSGTGKKVDFSPWPTYHNPPQTERHTALRPSFTKQAPYSRSIKPLKSILKLVNTPPPLTPDDIENRLGYFSPEKPESFEKMLQSVLHQLASPDRSARLDAYVALNGSLKAYEGMPDPRAMAARIPLITQFLSRDMVWKDPKGRLDTNIVSQSLQLACAILFNSQTSQALDDDFRAFLIDRSIFILEQADVSKNIIKTHLYLLSHQRLYAGILTAHRIERTLNAVKTLEERCSGNSAVAARLIIYQRLIEQAAVVMLNKMSDWIENVLHGLLSSNKDIRVRAIDACSKAGFILGTYQQASKSLNQVLEVEIEEGQTFGDSFNSRLVSMISDQDVGPDVPRIWASIVLLFRCKRRPIHKWPKFRDWLVTIQKCFNSNDLAIKQQASLAWNKLVFAVMPDSTTTEICRSMLKVPIVASLEKSGADRQSQNIRQFALDSYYNLLHYALRPGLSHQELDMAWDMYVEPVLTAISKSSVKGPQQSCRILSGILNKTNGVWNINAAMESEAIKPEDLPRLDIRWVRSRLRRIINIFEPILDSALQSPTVIPFFDDAWAGLWQTVAEAGSQEVRTSNELKDALAQITNLFGRVWRNGLNLHPEANTALWFQRLHGYLRITVETLGSGPFVEDVLSRTTDDEVEATPTPSNRLSKGHINTHSPLIFLFSLYYQPPPGIRTDESYRNSASWLIHFLTATKVSAIERLHILTQVIQHCPQLCASNIPINIAQQLWAVAARKAIDLLAMPNLVSNHETQSVGVALRHAMCIMTKGLQLSALNAENLEPILDLFNAMCDAAHRCGSDGAVIVAVIEPVSAVLKSNMDAVRIAVTSQLTTRMLERSVWPKDRVVLEHARKALYNISLEPTRSAAFEPFKDLFSLVTEISRQLYQQGFRDTTYDVPLAFLNSMAAFLHGCPPPLLPHASGQLQSGLAVWFQDPDRRVFPVPGTPLSTVADKLSRQTALTASRQVVPLWSKVVEAVCRIPRHDSDVLQSIDSLVIAGLSSPSRDIVNRTIVFWNDTFGTQVALEYPERLLPVLRARMDQTEMSAPCLPTRKEDEPVVTLPSFEESQPENLSPPRSSILKPRNRALLMHQHASPKQLNQKLTVERASRTGSSSKRKARLRHDDSQIDFEPITSSPLPYKATSQLLTDHQKDVRDAQQANAQMFPDLTSSPNDQSASLTRNIPKTLNFSSNPGQMEEDMVGTPTGPADGNLMSDDLPSSPTPRAMSRPAVFDDTEDLEADPPSSPPGPTDREWKIRRGPLFGQANTSPNVDTDAQETSVGLVNLPLSHVSTEKLDEQRQEMTTTVDRPSNVSSPIKTPVEPAKAGDAPEDAVQDADVENADSQNDLAKSQSTDHSEKVVESGSQTSSRGTRKRKRASDRNVTDQKRDQPSQPISAPQTSQQDESLDDADDEIVVLRRESLSTATHPAEEPAQAASPVQRRSGRKRKSETSQTSQSPSVQEEGLTRSTSVTNNNSSKKRANPVIVEDSPATLKVRKQEKTDDVKTATKFVKNQMQTRQGTKRHLSAVVIPDGAVRHSSTRTRAQNNSREHFDAESENIDNSNAVNPDSQLTQEHSAAIHGRPIAQPHSIIARLRGVLADCKKMIFGSQEERDLDDVLFELRREVHEASRRGRDV